MIRISRLSPDDSTAGERLAAILCAAFAEHWPAAWPTMDDARADVRDMLAANRILLVAREGQDDAIVGFVGGIALYDGRVWELHPLAVHPDRQREGIGRALVSAFESEVAARGGLTITLGTDDEDDMTTLAGVDVYDGLWGRIARIRNLKGHPYEFYQKLGYVIIGVVPDANGWGKPDILMGKRVQRRTV